MDERTKTPPGRPLNGFTRHNLHLNPFIRGLRAQAL
jgi:hypothetical protein